LQFGLNYELIYQLNAIEFLLCTFSPKHVELKVHNKYSIALSW